VQAAMRGVRAARTSGFGTLVADGVAPGAVAAWTIGALVAGALVAVAAGLPILWVVGCQCVAMGAGWLLRAHAVRRLGGVTGDVFGALIETATAVALIGVALW
jgi:adenosylcobinamide-GDP ribazoletransferase